MVEQVEESASRRTQAGNQKYGISAKAEIINLQDIKKHDYDRVSTKIDEFDRVLGGGIVPGSLILVSGDPGIGKSTLLTQLALNISENPPSLYVSGEESARQIKLRVDRISQGANLSVLNEVDVDVISSVIEDIKPSMVIVDSIQTLQTQDLESIPGSISQVRESAYRLQRIAKLFHIPIFIVGHVTKEGSIAGPKALEHIVDVVLSLEGDPASSFRILRSTKNRFGSIDEVGVFDMSEKGMIEVQNPSKMFLESASLKTPGSAVVVTLTGLRPLLLEIQALVTKSNFALPRRVSNGIDNNRLQLLVAVLQKRAGLALFDQDIFVNVTGGLKIAETAADLGVCIAIASSLKDLHVCPKTVFIGEVGLLGELRAVRQIDRRIKEAKKLGYTNIISSEKAKTLSEAIRQGLISKISN